MSLAGASTDCIHRGLLSLHTLEYSQKLVWVELNGQCSWTRLAAPFCYAVNVRFSRVGSPG